MHIIYISKFFDIVFLYGYSSEKIYLITDDNERIQTLKSAFVGYGQELLSKESLVKFYEDYLMNDFAADSSMDAFIRKDIESLRNSLPDDEE